VRPLYISGYLIGKEGDAFVVAFDNSASETRIRLCPALARKLSSELDGLLENTGRMTSGHSRLHDSQ
jgi:hypothetical protein